MDRRNPQLGHLLTHLEIVRSSQWKRVKGLGKLGTIMDALEQEPSWWSPDHPAITMYQRRRIAAGEFNQYRDLDRDLRVNNFLLLDELGRGGMGYVHKAWSINFGKLVAVKRTGSGHHINRDRLEREARILQLLDDPVIAQYVSWEPVEDGGGFLLAMEYIRGKTLRDYLSKHKQVSTDQAVEWSLSLLHALKHAHSRHVVHRDVTPRNIMIIEGAESSGVKLLDFGLGKIRDGVSNTLNVPQINLDLTQDQEALGTPQYMSPELWRDAASVTGASDVYSLGCNMYEMLAGRAPFAETQSQAVCIRHLDERPPDIRLFRPDIPDRLRATIHQMLEKEPDRRGTPEELISQLRTRRRFFRGAKPADSKNLESTEAVGQELPEALIASPEPKASAEVTEAELWGHFDSGTNLQRVLPRRDWKRRFIPQSQLSVAARCVEPTISLVEVFERLVNQLWVAIVVGILILISFAWFTMA